LRRVIRNSKTAPRFDWPLLLVFLGAAALSAAAVHYFFTRGYLLWFGDAEAHLNTARRITDSLTPGYDQIGTPWLPLPHLALLPFAAVDAWWHSGIAAALPGAVCFVAGVAFLFAAVRRISGSWPALAAAGIAALNPNLLYLQSTSMTEAYFFAELMALFYFSVRFRETQGWPSLAGAALATIAATLTRYEGWFLIPFCAVYFLVVARRHLPAAILYSAVASLGPLYWLGHNWYLTGDALAFYRGPYSARAIQGDAPYPGLHNWRLAWLYYRSAVQLCSGSALWFLAGIGIIVALVRRGIWPCLLLALPPIFYLWAMHSSGNPIHVPHLWPFSYYNTRYGLAALPLLAVAAASLVTLAPGRFRPVAALVLLVGTAIPWIRHPHPDAWITWVESRANSTGRRAWMVGAAQYLAPRYRLGAGILSSGGDDFFGIYRTMGIPLADTFSIDNGLPWDALLQRPELYMWQRWAVVKRGDPLDAALQLAARRGIRYQLEQVFIEKDEPVIEIYRRSGGP
jgi:Dolichyl-phosphate-mannose-protein mannosyltransferase